MKYFNLEVDDEGIAVVTFDRPPVNAVSYDVYTDLRDLTQEISANDDIRVVILTSPPGSRAFCGGADLHDFLELDYEKRIARYAMIRERVPQFYNLDRPVIGALNSHVIGAGVVLSGFCDIRIMAENAYLQMPEIERGAIAGGGIFFDRLNMPQGIIREIVFTARRFYAPELMQHGFLNYVVPEEEVMAKSFEIARLMTKKSLPALKANKIAANVAEGKPWQEGYALTNEASARLTVAQDAKEGIRAFLEGREAQYKDA